MALSGNLRDFSATQLLNLVDLARKSGTLEVKHQARKASLAFRDGKLVASSLGDSDGSLAAVLSATGKLNARQAEAIRARAKLVGDRQIGLQLIHAGYVTQADIIRSIKQVAIGTLQEFATWPEGEFRFEDGRLPGDDQITVPLDLKNIIIEMSRLLASRERWLADLPSLDVALRFTEQPDKLLRGLKLSPEEWKVINFVKSDNSLYMIARALNMTEDQIRRVVYGLRQAGVVEVMRARPLDGGARPKPPVSTSRLKDIIAKIKSL